MLASRAMKYAAHAGRRKLIRKQDVLLTRRTSYRNPANLRPKPSSTNSASVMER